jgi:hypothetical protein
MTTPLEGVVAQCTSMFETCMTQVLEAYQAQSDQMQT